VLALTLDPVLPSVALAQRADQYCRYRTDAIVVFLVDVTTRTDDHDREELISALDSLFKALRFGERLVVRTIEDRFENSRTLFDACLPGCPPDAGLASECRPVMARTHTVQFKERLIAGLREVYDNRADKRSSDLLNTLRFHMSILRGYEQRQLWFFSDMLENKSVDIRKDDVTLERLLARLRAENLMVDLKNVNVHIYGMARSDSSRNRNRLRKAEYDRVTTFWRLYFRANGASIVHIQE
jgi:hypothetical protein